MTGHRIWALWFWVSFFVRCLSHSIVLDIIFLERLKTLQILLAFLSLSNEVQQYQSFQEFPSLCFKKSPSWIFEKQVYHPQHKLNRCVPSFSSIYHGKTPYLVADEHDHGLRHPGTYRNLFVFPTTDWNHMTPPLFTQSVCVHMCAVLRA